VSLQHLIRRSPDAPADLRGEILGGAAIGDLKDLAPVAWPRQPLRAPVLPPGAAPVHEQWRIDGPLRHGQGEGIQWRRNAELLYGVIELHEDEDTAPAEGGSPLQTASRRAYERLFRLLREQGTPHLWRVWNYMADINGESHGLERYRQFNLGRHEAFVQAQRETGGQVPAACALGVAAGPLSVAFLAGTSPVVPLENPRQVSAWRYPSQYGPRAPTFSRAALAYPRGGEALFVSGTASIVGHATVHAGDVAAQCLETVRNIECLAQEANRVARSGRPFSFAGMSHRAYVRHAADADTVQRTLQPLLRGAALVCVQADVCRADLLVEIESQAIHPMAPP
jgi:hypothetical protein